MSSVIKESKDLYSVVKFYRIMRLDSALNHLKQIVFPNKCRICAHSDKDNKIICKACKDLLPYCKHVCHQCGLPTTFVNQDLIPCGRCQNKPPIFNTLYSPFWYQAPIKQMIMEFKYEQHWQTAQTLADFFIEHLTSFRRQALLLPIPSHASRVRQRGFNANHELTKLITKKLAIKSDIRMLKRIRNTDSQTGKTAKQRQQNVTHAFSINQPIVHDEVILFDDVVTTGATINEVCKLLKQAGVQKIHVWCLARTKQVTSNWR